MLTHPSALFFVVVVVGGRGGCCFIKGRCKGASFPKKPLAVWKLRSESRRTGPVFQQLMDPFTASCHRQNSVCFPRTPLTAQGGQEDVWDALSKECFKPCPQLFVTSRAAKRLATSAQAGWSHATRRSGHMISPASDKIVILELDCFLYSPRSHFQRWGEKAFDPLNAFVKGSLLASDSLSKINIQSFRLEGTFKGHLVRSSAQSSNK